MSLPRISQPELPAPGALIGTDGSGICVCVLPSVSTPPLRLYSPARSVTPATAQQHQRRGLRPTSRRRTPKEKTVRDNLAPLVALAILAALCVVIALATGIGGIRTSE